MATTIESVRELALSLPRSYEALVRDRVKFRVGQIVYLAFSRISQTFLLIPASIAGVHLRD